MNVQSITADQIRIQILVKIFLNNLTENKLNTKRFRVQNHDHLDLIDSLLHANYIIQQQDKYYLRVEALFEIAETQPEAKRYIGQAQQLFLLLQDEYKQDPDKVITLNEIAEKSGLTRENINTILYYLIDAPGVIAGRTTDLTQKDAYVCPAESILKYKSLEELVDTIRSWRKPKKIERYIGLESPHASIIMDFSFLLHPQIIKHALAQYQDGHLRNAVLDSMTAVFDYIRYKTGLQDEDGDRLIGKVFSLEEPLLVLSEIDTESGKSDQKGFMQIFKGTYQGIRNPKAHKLENDLTPLKAAQYMVFASMLIRRVEDAKLIEKNPT